MTHLAEPVRRGRRRRALLEWLIIIGVAILVTLAVRTWVLETYVIPSGSMEPTIQIDDRVLVNKLAYDFGTIHRGDIIVFRRTPADDDPAIKELIKRVIGLPGQTLESGPHGEILVNGRAINQPWVGAAVLEAPQPTICDPSSTFSHTDCQGPVLHLPAGEYYVMGDNRSDSADSRYWGPVPTKLIIGRACLRIWPLTRFHWF